MKRREQIAPSQVIMKNPRKRKKENFLIPVMTRKSELIFFESSFNTDLQTLSRFQEVLQKN